MAYRIGASKPVSSFSVTIRIFGQLAELGEVLADLLLLLFVEVPFLHCGGSLLLPV